MSYDSVYSSKTEPLPNMAERLAQVAGLVTRYSEELEEIQEQITQEVKPVQKIQSCLEYVRQWEEKNRMAMNGKDLAILNSLWYKSLPTLNQRIENMHENNQAALADNRNLKEYLTALFINLGFPPDVSETRRKSKRSTKMVTVKVYAPWRQTVNSIVTDDRYDQAKRDLKVFYNRIEQYRSDAHYAAMAEKHRRESAEKEKQAKQARMVAFINILDFYQWDRTLSPEMAMSSLCELYPQFQILEWMRNFDPSADYLSDIEPCFVALDAQEEYEYLQAIENPYANKYVISKFGLIYWKEKMATKQQDHYNVISALIKENKNV